jgi:NADH:ubiquinone oxidoreductase subunit F (NADH-binding)
MATVQRVLDLEPVTSLDQYVDAGGGRGLEAGRRLGPEGVIDDIAASGLRGRGGAGFPTGVKWRTVAANRSSVLATTVVVNGAEGEPGSFKDRAILRANPYRVLEGALAAAMAMGADGVIVGLKASFEQEVGRVRGAIEELRAAGWADGVELMVATGPSEYLFGEETALLEVIDGRYPFPRIDPPYRRGVDDVTPDPGSRSAAEVELAGPGGDTSAPPTLVDNVETMANVPGILAEGPDWFRSVGTKGSPGTAVCTVSGRTRRAGVAEFAMGTPLSEVIQTVGRGPKEGFRITAVISGVANPILPESLLDTPISYEAMEAAGSGLGANGFIVFDDTTDLVALVHGVARFLAVESCGQCAACKQDGLEIATLLDRMRRSDATKDDLDELTHRVDTVAEGARCFLAYQQQRVVGSLLQLFPEVVRSHVSGQAPPAETELIAPIVDINGSRVVLDEHEARKQPDWTFDEIDSGQWPADRLERSAPERG